MLFVLLWSANARESRYVDKELFLAKASGRNALPIAIQGGPRLPPELADMKYLDVARDPRVQLDWLRSHMTQLAHSKQNHTAVTWALTAFMAYAVFAK